MRPAVFNRGCRICLLILFSAPLLGETYYLDCTLGSDLNAGTAETSPWQTLEKVNQTTFTAGDRILLKRGERCKGMLWAKGSGEAGKPILIGAYGEGPLPIISAGGNQAALKLFDQEYWRIENVETTGGSPYGIYVAGDGDGVLRSIHIRNVVVRDVSGELKSKSSGLIVVASRSSRQAFDDIVIDGATAYNTTQWSGIIVVGASRDVRTRKVRVRNCIVHDVYGDGIVLFQVEDGVIERSAAWNTGLQPTQTIGTPNGIWTWRCRNCVVQYTEGFFIDSPGVDGGVYDIDWGNDDNVIQYNFGHDAMGYCASVFGAGGEITANSVVRYNVCVNNGRSPKLARRQGDIFLTTWEGGSLDGVKIHNNTFYWNPPIDAPVLNAVDVKISGTRANLFANNLIWSAVPSMIENQGSLTMDHNLYWYAGRSDPKWRWKDETYSGWRNYRENSGQDQHGLYADPRLDTLLRLRPGSPAIDAALSWEEMGSRDGYGHGIPWGEAFDIGAAEYQPRAPQVASHEEVALPRFRSRWVLVSCFSPDSDDSRGQLVFLKTALHQYAEKGLEVAVAFEPDRTNLNYDWDLGDIQMISDPGIAVKTRPTTLLLSPEGTVFRRWTGFIMPAELGLTLRRLLGPPVGSPPVEMDSEAKESP